MRDDAPRPGWRRLLRFRARERDLGAEIDDELRFHLESRVEALRARGVPEAEAWRLTMERFGDVDAVRGACDRIGHERHRVERRRLAIADLRQDVRYAGRVLRRQALPSVIIVFCLALGIGAATTVFSIGDALLLRPPPFPNGSRLVTVGTIRGPGGALTVSSFEDFTDWRERQRSFDALGAYQREVYTIVTPDGVRLATGASATSGVMAALGIRPLRGRLLETGDDAPGAPPVAVVTTTWATRVLGGTDSVLGAGVRLTDRTVPIVGMIAAADAYPDEVELWVSMPRTPSEPQRGTRSLELIGVVRDGIGLAAAEQDLRAVAAQVAREGEGRDPAITAGLRPLRERYVGASRSAFGMIAAAAGLILLIACANVAGLQLARATARIREMAVRSALGAGGRRIVRQLLTESVILAVTGGAAGVAVAYASIGVVAASIPARFAPWMTPAIDLRVLAFTLMTSAVTGIVFGLAPAVRLSRIPPARILHGGPRSGLDARRLTLQRGFVALQLALSLILLVGASLAARSFTRLTSVAPGFQADRVMMFRIGLRGARYESDASRAQLATSLVERLATMPDVTGAAATSHVPIADCCSRFGLTVEGETRSAGAEHMITGSVVTPDFFRTMGIALRRGRPFDDSDRADAPFAVVINEEFERRLFGGANALGRAVFVGSRTATVIGVVGDVKQTSLMDAPEPQFYQVQAQVPWDALTVVMRYRGVTGASLIAPARAIVRDLDPNLPIYNARPLADAIEGAVASQRMFRSLLGGFAAIALLLAVAGLYGVTSYLVAQRLPEMGIRLALGARPASVAGLVLRQGVVLVAIGISVGLAGATAAARVLASMLYGVTAREPAAYVAAAAVLGVVALLACIVPARRAATADPLAVMRAE